MQPKSCICNCRSLPPVQAISHACQMLQQKLEPLYEVLRLIHAWWDGQVDRFVLDCSAQTSLEMANCSCAWSSYGLIIQMRSGCHIVMNHNNYTFTKKKCCPLAAHCCHADETVSAMKVC